uniref:WAP domain-containing protein n=1 Tax=Naja naja TaxID=35670 RepID=A0A8C6Y2Z0_NAJNA
MGSLVLFELGSFLADISLSNWITSTVQRSVLFALCMQLLAPPGLAPPGTITICPVRCQSDWQCDGKQKCCTYACITDCMDAI